MDFTPVIRPFFEKRAQSTDRWASDGEEIQRGMLKTLLKRGSGCEAAEKRGLRELVGKRDPYPEFASRVEPIVYEDIRRDVMRMIAGERDVLWRGVCRDYAQSSGTSGGRSKYIPITPENLIHCHYHGASYSVAHYLRNTPESRLFSGKGMILGGSFANGLNLRDPRVRVGDLSATLISKINPFVNLFRVPGKRVALLPDWKVKLPALVESSIDSNVTNISGVPSWFLTVIKEIMKRKGTDNLSEVWPNLEVFFHGGISFEPYREEYRRITDSSKMHFVETYNASEGFFAVQNDPDDRSMLLIIDNDIFYEFLPIDGSSDRLLPIWEIEVGKVYELLITSSNGLWRYRTGDTVRVDSVAPVKIRIAGRTKSFINAFGEELMEENAERAIADVCRQTGSSIANYTAAPVFAEGNHRGRHQWLIEWNERPADVADFATKLDAELRRLNSDYDAKRANTIFLDPLEIISVKPGTFDRWLASVGTHKLGGQRKVPRLSNDRHIADTILTLRP